MRTGSAWLLLAICCCVGANAGVTGGDLGAAAAASAPAGADGGQAGVATRRSPGAAAPETMDLLVDMQPRRAGLAFDKPTAAAQARAARDAAVPRSLPDAPLRPDAGGAGSQSPAAAPVPAPAVAGALFGSGSDAAALPSRPQRQPPDDPAVLQQQRLSATAAARDQPPSAAMAAQLPPWMLWPREWLAAIRDNRGTVIAVGMAMLAAVGLAELLRRRGR